MNQLPTFLGLRLFTAAFMSLGACASAAHPATPASEEFPVVGYIGSNQSVLELFLAGMSDAGYVAEQDFHLELRYTENSLERRKQVAAELVALCPDVIVATGLASDDLKELTKTIPIVLMATPEVVGLR